MIAESALPGNDSAANFPAIVSLRADPQLGAIGFTAP
jgi:hypothetical protein